LEEDERCDECGGGEANVVDRIYAFKVRREMSILSSSKQNDSEPHTHSSKKYPAPC
jgi:hypothetical protein